MIYNYIKYQLINSIIQAKKDISFNDVTGLSINVNDINDIEVNFYQDVNATLNYNLFYYVNFLLCKDVYNLVTSSLDDIILKILDSEKMKKAV